MKKTKVVAAGLAATAMLLGACSENNVRDYRDTHTSRAPTSDEMTEKPTDGTDEPSDGDTTDAARDSGQTAKPEELSTDIGLDMSNQPAVVTWETPGETFHVYTQGSSTEGCYAVPTEAWTDGERIEIDFDPVDTGRACTMDLVSHGWSFTWDDPLDVTGEMVVTLRGLKLTGRDDIVLPSEPTEPLA
ncbi:hypothetical protein [Flaviflexus huanghaiensis]|uniref:hypothetical protein n=1 Tax=Flaviflexus huanghaiensis TaxID=1111473 RepID=UPI0015FA3DB2|nr:hypothetical protein [Flaviflexus huanghaiensis]